MLCFAMIEGFLISNAASVMWNSEMLRIIVCAERIGIFAVETRFA